MPVRSCNICSKVYCSGLLSRDAFFSDGYGFPRTCVSHCTQILTVVSLCKEYQVFNVFSRCIARKRYVACSRDRQVVQLTTSAGAKMRLPFCALNCACEKSQSARLGTTPVETLTCKVFVVRESTGLGLMGVGTP